MEKKNIDWSSLGFGYIKTDKRFVANYKDGAWDNGTLTEDDKVVINECAGVLQYAQTCFEGLKAYTTEDGHIVMFRPDLNAARMKDSCERLEMPVYPEDIAMMICFLTCMNEHTYRFLISPNSHTRDATHKPTYSIL